MYRETEGGNPTKIILLAFFFALFICVNLGPFGRQMNHQKTDRNLRYSVLCRVIRGYFRVIRRYFGVIWALFGFIFFISL